MRVTNILFAISILSIYLLSLIGIGRYSCHCEHSSQITFLGVVTKCECTHQGAHYHQDFECVCGGELEATHHDKDDCCAVEYTFLKADQSLKDITFNVILSSSAFLLPQITIIGEMLSLQQPIIKNFHALFWRRSVPIFQRNSQLLL